MLKIVVSDCKTCIKRFEILIVNFVVSILLIVIWCLICNKFYPNDKDKAFSLSLSPLILIYGFGIITSIILMAFVILKSIYDYCKSVNYRAVLISSDNKDHQPIEKEDLESASNF